MSAWAALEPWGSLLLYQLSMSLLSVGGVITLAAEQHRHMVDEAAWLTDAQFQASITLAQAAPGPNVLFMALWGWHVGLNAAAQWPGLGPWLGAFGGLVAAMVGALGPSSVLAIWATRWSQSHAQHRMVRALRMGLAPTVVGAMFATSTVLVRSLKAPTEVAVGLALVSALLVWRTRIHVMVLLAGGGLVGALLARP